MRQIPQNHIHTRSTPFWNKEHLAPAGLSNATLIRGTRPGVYPRSDAGAVKHLGYADEHCSEPEEHHAINAVAKFGVFPPEKWHNIEVRRMIYFNIDFLSRRKY